MTIALKPNTEPIPGYHVTERLGTGGYGEVWKAEAPGGLQKAIKFIYGYLSDDKATRELKALNRIKQIRHPFLLSLERIEVVDGQLLIVTELADGSLKDRFEACQEAGLTAIPRAELLAHLHDAADALDFLSENALQHLDVKPENLLLVGGRMKVADFGLLKDIQDRTYSAMGGMTPVYAAPELFDGRPSAASDQYSLAIVFQEMLTGVLPFPGTTAAQLTSQHLHSKPRLETLSPGDQEIIGRALAKDPLDRFSSSRELIDSLMGTANSASTAIPAARTPRLDDPSRETKGVCGQDTKSHGGSSHDSASAIARRPAPLGAPLNPKPGISRPSDARTKTVAPPIKAPVVELPPIDMTAEEVGLRPTLFVGIGGTAGYVLRRLRRRLNDRFGLANVPIWQLLLIDSDVSALAPQSDGPGELEPGETLAMPLRRPQEYREDSLEILQWLSRRWLYNIPRSLKTEGLRPLGRLALVDHAHQLFERLREILARTLAPESIEQAQRATGVKLRDATPRVFVVASSAGGTGSGMVLDVAYVLRMIMADMGVSDQGLCGMLVHSTRRNVSAKDLAVANTYACLGELNHYSQDAAAESERSGLGGQEQHSTFPVAYFVDLGDRLSEPEFAAATDSIAEYLYLDAATAGGSFFDKCRPGVSPVEPGDFQLRSFGVCRLGASHDVTSAASEWLARQVVDHWVNGSADKQAASNSDRKPADDPAEKLIAALKIETDSIVQRFRFELSSACPQAVLAQLATALVREPAPTASEALDCRWMRLVARTKQLLGLSVRRPEDAAPVVCLKSVVDSIVGKAADQLSVQLVQRVVALADRPHSGLSGAVTESERLVERLRKLEQEFAAGATVLQEQISQYTANPFPATTGRKSPRRPDESPERIAQALVHLMGLFVEHKAMESGLRLMGSLVHAVLTTNEYLMRLRHEMRAFLNGFDKDAWDFQEPHSGQQGAAAEVEQVIRRQLCERLPKLAIQFEQQMASEMVAPRGGLFALLSGNSEEVRGLPAELRSLARRAVVEAIQQLDIAGIVQASRAEGAPQRLLHCIQSASPRVLRCGGATRLLLTMPPGQSAVQLTEIAMKGRRQPPSVVYDSSADIVACYEVEQVHLANLAAALAYDDPQCIEVAHRLHTRVDVQWSAI